MHTLTKEALPSASSLSQCCSSAALFRLSRVEPGSEGAPEWWLPWLEAAVSLETERGISTDVSAAQEALQRIAQVTCTPAALCLRPAV